MTTFVSFLLDESSSMFNVMRETVDGYNSYLDNLKDIGDDVVFSLVKFSSAGVKKVVVTEDIRGVERMSRSDYQPNGSTPLVDACMKTIKATESALAKRSDSPKVIVVFQTDGQENCSVEYKTPDLKREIESKTELGWQFVFLGAEVDSYSMAGSYGISLNNTISYDKKSTGKVFGALNQATRNYVSGMTASASFSKNDRLDAGDDHYSRYLKD